MTKKSVMMFMTDTKRLRLFRHWPSVCVSGLHGERVSEDDCSDAVYDETDGFPWVDSMVQDEG